MSVPFLGEIRLFAGNFAPRNWAFCNGQILSIAQNTALFAILGTTYGGNGQTTFALPDLRGRVPLSAGQGPGLSPYSLGQQGGTEAVTLTAAQMPIHNHGVTVAAASAPTSLSPSGNLLGVSSEGGMYAPAGSANGSLASTAITSSGGGQPHSVMQPHLALNYIIAIYGTFPSRN